MQSLPMLPLNGIIEKSQRFLMMMLYVSNALLIQGLSLLSFKVY